LVRFYDHGPAPSHQDITFIIDHNTPYKGRAIMTGILQNMGYHGAGRCFSMGACHRNCKHFPAQKPQDGRTSMYFISFFLEKPENSIILRNCRCINDQVFIGLSPVKGLNYLGNVIGIDYANTLLFQFQCQGAGSTVIPGYQTSFPPEVPGKSTHSDASYT